MWMLRCLAGFHHLLPQGPVGVDRTPWPPPAPGFMHCGRVSPALGRISTLPRPVLFFRRTPARAVDPRLWNGTACTREPMRDWNACEVSVHGRLACCSCTKTGKSGGHGRMPGQPIAGRPDKYRSVPGIPVAGSVRACTIYSTLSDERRRRRSAGEQEQWISQIPWRKEHDGKFWIW